jgi:hypothetical protein
MEENKNKNKTFKIFFIILAFIALIFFCLLCVLAIGIGNFIIFSRNEEVTTVNEERVNNNDDNNIAQNPLNINNEDIQALARGDSVIIQVTEEELIQSLNLGGNSTIEIQGNELKLSINLEEAVSGFAPYLNNEFDISILNNNSVTLTLVANGGKNRLIVKDLSISDPFINTVFNSLAISSINKGLDEAFAAIESDYNVTIKDLKVENDRLIYTLEPI